MTKKDLRVLAADMYMAYGNISKDKKSIEAFFTAIRHLIRSLYDISPRFQKEKFLELCGFLEEYENWSKG